VSRIENQRIPAAVSDARTDSAPICNSAELPPFGGWKICTRSPVSKPSNPSTCPLISSCSDEKSARWTTRVAPAPCGCTRLCAAAARRPRVGPGVVLGRGCCRGWPPPSRTVTGMTDHRGRADGLVPVRNVRLVASECPAAGVRGTAGSLLCLLNLVINQTGVFAETTTHLRHQFRAWRETVPEHHNASPKAAGMPYADHSGNTMAIRGM
jgi:hypothetical protein